MAALSTRDRSRVKYHLGYLAVQPAASIQFGIPRPIETMFLVEDALNYIIDDGWNIQNILRILNILDNIECKMVEGQDYLPASKLGNLDVRPDHIAQLLETYYDWSGKLADILGVPPYPYARRNQAAVLGSGNVRVRR